jgi:hypothetical protein
MFAAMRRMLVRLALATAILAIGGSEVLAHGTRSNFSMTFPNGFGRTAFTTHGFSTNGFSTFPRATTFSRGIWADRVIVIERPVFFRPAFDGCGRRLFITTPSPFTSPCFGCSRGFTRLPWAMQTRSFSGR